uniref:Uncharacterized protein n=1 Tax=uncultured prokaryote TaxID=198431 RepID=A0A0H5Q6K4_9ZZZZ|nr:hypothetical protein [uncultured prokaryote]
MIIPPGYGSAAFILSGAVGTPDYVTTCGVDLSGAGGAWTDAANQLFRCYQYSLLNRTLSAYDLEKVVLAVGNDGPGGAVVSDLTAVAGSRSGSGEPIAMAPILRKSTNVLGRPGRGRMFIPGALGDDETDSNGDISTAVRDALQTAAEGFHDLLTTTTERSSELYPAALIDVPFNPVLLHSTVMLPTAIEGFSIAPKVGWIRKRLR